MNLEPAFPHKESDNQMGLTIRDYFAAKAMQALITRQGYFTLENSLPEFSYKCADAMIAERSRR